MDGQSGSSATPGQPGHAPYGVSDPYGAPAQAGPDPYASPTGYGYPQPGGYGPPTGYGYPQPGGYGPPSSYGYPQPGYLSSLATTQRNGLGIWALILGIVAFVPGLSILTGIPAIILGIMSRRAVARGEASNGGMGLAGVILGWLSVAAAVLVFLLIAMMISIASSGSPTHTY